ncbi:hypothetical protein ACIBCN_06110 [Nocardia sp. NPDC051052]|uniref:hypothetical protein n=1 Tax=Nocardia sp. NPDC051052 TaxID=3364322 RepID=UPI0037B39EE3
MGDHVDAVLLQIGNSAGVHDIVFPSSDSGRARIRTLLSAVYQLPFAIVRDVTAVDVVAVECARPLFPVVRRTGNWTQTMPAHMRTDVDIVGSDGAAPRWIDVVADLSATVLLEIDPGELDSLRISDIGDFATLAEFRAKFRYLDLEAFMRANRLTTVEDLRGAFHYLLAEAKLKPAPPFDPTDPAASRRLAVRIGVLIRDDIDLTDALREVRQMLAAQEPVVDEHRDRDFAEISSHIAPLVVFPASAVTGSGFTQEQIIAFFAGQRTLAVFV